MPLSRLLCLCGPLLLVPALALADPVCKDPEDFAANGWRHEEVKQAMDDYLRDHRMRANWPVPPDAAGRDYYEWLWINEFGASMKAELTQRFCGGAGSKADGPGD